MRVYGAASQRLSVPGKSRHNVVMVAQEVGVDARVEAEQCFCGGAGAEMTHAHLGFVPMWLDLPPKGLRDGLHKQAEQSILANCRTTCSIKVTKEHENHIKREGMDLAGSC